MSNNFIYRKLIADCLRAFIDNKSANSGLSVVWTETAKIKSWWIDFNIRLDT